MRPALLVLLVALSGCSFGGPCKGASTVCDPGDDGTSATVTLTRPTGPGTSALGPILEVSPLDLDFGAIGIGCDASATVTFTNAGDADLVVSDAVYTSGSADLALDPSGLPLPLTLTPGASASVEARYAPLDEIADRAVLTVYSNDPTVPELQGEHRGAGARIGEQTDTFVQGPPPTDVLFVVDNSCSMAEEQGSLANNFSQFIQMMTDTSSDYQVAVITTDSPTFLGPIIDDSTSDPNAEFVTQAHVGTGGSGNEMGVEMAFQATQPGADGAEFLREDARLSIVFVSDEVDASQDTTGRTWAEYVAWFESLKTDVDLVGLHAIAGDYPAGCGSASPGIGYYEVVNATGGVYLSVCAQDWASHLLTIGQSASALDDDFPLSALPVPESIEVWVDGVEVTTGWSWSATGNSVEFEEGAVPESGAGIEIRYVVLGACET